MHKPLREQINSLVPEAFWDIITTQEVELYLTEGMAGTRFFDCMSTLTCEEKAKIKDEKPSKVDTPCIDDVLPDFLAKLKALNLQHDERRMLISFHSEKPPSFAEIKQLEQAAFKIAGCVPLVFTLHGSNIREASIHGLMVTGQSKSKEGMRLAFDLDNTLTRWPEQFSEIGNKNRQAGGFNLIISTRHEPPNSGCYQAVYKREYVDIENTGLQADRLAHAWFDFDLWYKLFPFFTDTQWFDRFIWTKAFYCRLFKIDAFYEDQKRNIDRLEKIAPDVRIIEVSGNNQPTIPDYLSQKDGPENQSL